MLQNVSYYRILQSLFLQGRNSLSDLYHEHFFSLIRTFFIKGQGLYYHFFLFGLWDLNLELSFLLGHYAGNYCNSDCSWVGGYLIWFLRSQRPASISSTGPFSSPLWASLILWSCVCLPCVQHHAGPAFWLHFSEGILWLFISHPAVSTKLQRLHGGSDLLFKSFEKMFCKIIKSIIANTMWETVSYKVLG